MEESDLLCGYPNSTKETVVLGLFKAFVNYYQIAQAFRIYISLLNQPSIENALHLQMFMIQYKLTKCFPVLH